MLRKVTLLVLACVAVTLVAGESIQGTFKQHGVIPDVLDSAPKALAIVRYGSKRASLGNELTPTAVKAEPGVQYPADKEAYYTLAMVDPDAPSRDKPLRREFLHWLVTNIPGNSVADGHVLAAYIGAGPPKDTGLHRYVILVYKQPAKLTFDEERIPSTSSKGRPSFSIRKFAAKYKIGSPVAGNFFQAQYDDYVPTLQQQLSG